MKHLSSAPLSLVALLGLGLVASACIITDGGDDGDTLGDGPNADTGDDHGTTAETGNAETGHAEAGDTEAGDTAAADTGAADTEAADTGVDGDTTADPPGGMTCVDEACACGAGETCELVCEDTTSCEMSCASDSTCDMTCASGSQCAVACADAASCEVDCADAATCTVTCPASGCVVDHCEFLLGGVCVVTCDDGSIPVQNGSAVTCG